VVCALTALTWQFLTVHYNYEGNWSALFRTGSSQTVPPQLAFEKIYRTPHPVGWDGQIYHYIAHDPWLRHGTGAYLSAPRLSYRRILVPGLAWVLSFGGSPQLVDSAYRLVLLAFFFLGGYWLARLASLSGRHPAWGLVFFFVPAALTSLERMGIDVALAALCVGVAVYTRPGQSGWKLYAVLAAAGFTRETGLLLLAAYCAVLLIGKQFARAALFATGGIPALLWFGFVWLKTPPVYYPGFPPIPFSGVFDRFLHPPLYSFSPALSALLTCLDLLAAAGVVFAIVLGIRRAWQNRRDALGWAMLFFACVALFLWRVDDWPAAVDYARILSPLLIFLAVLSFKRFSWLNIAPFLMVLPRLGMDVGSEVLGVAKGILRIG
jgi:hypothetical protein